VLVLTVPYVGIGTWRGVGRYFLYAAHAARFHNLNATIRCPNSPTSHLVGGGNTPSTFHDEPEPMSHPARTAVLLLLTAACAPARHDVSVVTSATLAITGVSVIPMDRDTVLTDQTVLVDGDRIVAMGASREVTVPAAAARVDGTGRYLMPGLTDMHVHLSADTGASGVRLRRLMGLLVANGVTTARSMLGHPSHLTLREAILADEVVGPTLVLAGPQITGPNAQGYFAQFSAATPAAAGERVRDHRATGYDFLKVTFGMTPEVYEALAAEAVREGMPLAGHVTSDIGLERAIGAGQQIEHLDGYLEASVASNAPVRRIGSQGIPGEILEHVDTAAMRRAAEATARAGIYNTPTLNLFEVAFFSDAPTEELLRQPDARFFTAAGREAMAAQREQFAGVRPDERMRRAAHEFRRAMVRALRDAGAPLMVGSDTPQQFMMFGFATRREIASLVDAGLTQFEALEAATAAPARYLDAAGDFGVVRVGGRADLILLDRNPREDVGALGAIRGVVLRGRWIDSAALTALADAAEVQE
jgi:imidazolonepropionase-like amidohydrolase